MLLWVSDSHLNFLKRDDGAFRFVQCLAEENPNADGLILTGDISSGEVLEKHLTQIAQGFPNPIYFILGNHDHYNSSFKEIDELIPKLTKKFGNLFWLNEGWVSEFHPRSPNDNANRMAIVGVNGWYDAYHGNTKTFIEINDFTAIKELSGLNYRDLMIDLVRERAKKEADRLDDMLKMVCETPKDIILVATHVPPYPESAWHEGSHSDRDWQPWFTSASIGAVLDKYAEKNTDKKFVVLTGHTHSPGIYERRDNLVVYTGGAKYYFPELAGKIDVGAGKIEVLNSSGKKEEREFP
jgi:predicted phosphodiesterase